MSDSMIDAYRPPEAEMDAALRAAQAARACRSMGYTCALISLDDVEALLRAWDKLKRLEARE